MANYELSTRVLDCPKCRTPLVMLPCPFCGLAANWDKTELPELPGDITDPEDKRVAKFTIIDDDGQYKCPECLGTSSVPGAHP
jgi:hypothetical protein